MSLKLLVDVNLSPRWVDVFVREGWEAAHWSQVGDPRAPDRVIMTYAAANGYVVFTHDLDFGAILAVTQAASPSVIQIRAQDVLPDHLAGLVVKALKHYEGILQAGALIVVDERRLRARVLPLAGRNMPLS